MLNFDWLFEVNWYFWTIWSIIGLAFKISSKSI